MGFKGLPSVVGFRACQFFPQGLALSLLTWYLVSPAGSLKPFEASAAPYTLNLKILAAGIGQISIHTMGLFAHGARSADLDHVALAV